VLLEAAWHAAWRNKSNSICAGTTSTVDAAQLCAAAECCMRVHSQPLTLCICMLHSTTFAAQCIHSEQLHMLISAHTGSSHTSSLLLSHRTLLLRAIMCHSSSCDAICQYRTVVQRLYTVRREECTMFRCAQSPACTDAKYQQQLLCVAHTSVKCA
jgi:hypothetical protein